MPAMDFRYTKTTEKAIPQAVSGLISALANHKFAMLWHLDMGNKLKEKGLAFDGEFHIFEVCNAAKAKQLLDQNLEFGYLLPCKVVLYRKEGTTHIGLLRPEALIGLIGDDSVAGLAREVEEELKAVVDEAVR
ncbi:MAG: DUF302 domain-containing protein [Mycobacterium leprae]